MAVYPALPVGLQSKLSVGRSDDPLEAEADRLAEQAVGATVAIDAKVGAAGPAVSRKCARCEEEEETTVSRKASAADQVAARTEAPAMVDEALRAAGRSLDAGDRRFFEERFGHDLSGVRIHADQRGAESAAAVNAHAYTVGQHVVFGAGRYEPGSATGRRLLAHELVHTIQQGGRAISAGARRTGTTNVSRAARQVSREEAPKAAKPSGGKVKLITAYLAKEGKEPATIVFHTATGALSYVLEPGDLAAGEYVVNVINLSSRGKGIGEDKSIVGFQFQNASANFHFNYDVNPGQEDPSSLFPAYETVNFTVTDEAQPVADPTKKKEVRDPHATYLPLEEALNKCNAGQIPNIKTFPYRGTRFGAAPLEAFREGDDIVVKSYTYVRSNDDFRAQTRTLPVETFIGGVHLAPDEVVRVHTYEPKWYQLNITGSASSDTQEEFCLTGEEMLEMGARSRHDTLANIGMTVVDAATFFIPVGKFAGMIGKPIAKLAGRGASALGISVMLGLRDVAPTALAGIASRGFVLVEGQAVDQVASRAVSKSVGHILLNFGESGGAEAVTNTATHAAVDVGAHAVGGRVAQAGAEAAARTVTVTVVDAAGHQAVSVLTTPTGSHEVDQMIEQAFAATFDQTIDHAATAAPGQGVVSVAPEIAAGFTQAHVTAFKRFLAKSFSAPELAVLDQEWANAARAGDQAILNASNARYLFGLQRNRFWTAVSNNPVAKQLFEDAGCVVPGGGKAPYYMLNGRRIVMTIDHILERQSAPQLALTGANLRISFSRENSVVLRLLNQLSPF